MASTLKTPLPQAREANQRASLRVLRHLEVAILSKHLLMKEDQTANSVLSTWSPSSLLQLVGSSVLPFHLLAACIVPSTGAVCMSPAANASKVPFVNVVRSQPSKIKWECIW